MTIAQLLAITTVLTVWCAAAAVLCGIGLLGRRREASARLGVDSLLRAFWFGLVVVVAVAQVWHLMRPIDGALVAALVALGVIGWLGCLHGLADLIPRTRAGMCAFVGVALFTLWAAMAALGAPIYFDAGNYHLPTVQWLVAHPIVPGLGNLHDRLAFNNSSLLVTALLEAVLPNRSQHFATGLFVLPMTTLIAGRAVALFSEGSERRAANAAPLLLLTPLVGVVFSSLICSTSTDAPANFAVMFAMVWLFDLLNDRTHDARWRSRTALLIVAVLTLGVVFKVSLVVVGALGSALALIAAPGWKAGTAWRERLWNRTNVIGCVIAAALLAPWMARGVVTSGYPVYPFTFGAFPVEWRIPEEQARIVKRLALTDARLARHITDVTSPRLEGFRWVPIWLRNQFAGVQFGMVVLPIAIALTALGAAAAARLLMRTERRSVLSGHETLASIPIVTAIIVWFFTIPAPRFSACLFWPLAALSGAIFVGVCLPQASRRTLALLVAGSLLLGASPVVGSLALSRLTAFKSPALLLPANTENGFFPLPTPEVTEFRTRSGLRLLTPSRDPRMWNAALPNTPFPSPRIKQRDPARMASGFIYDRTASPRPPGAALQEARDYLAAQAKPGDVVYADDAARAFLMQSPVSNAYLVVPALAPGETPTLEDHLIALGRLRGKPRVWFIFADGPASGLFDPHQPLVYLLDWMGTRATTFHASEGGASVYLFYLPKFEGNENEK